MKMDKEFFRSLDLTPQPDRLHEILTAYTKYLEQNMYLDSDWWCEDPNTVDAFLKNHPQENNQQPADYWREKLGAEIESLKKQLCDNEEKFSDMNAELHARQVRIDELMGLADKTETVSDEEIKQEAKDWSDETSGRIHFHAGALWMRSRLKNSPQENPK